MYFFFFQAEDGIRDLTVTGVQTCALPISGRLEKEGELRRVRTEVDPVLEITEVVQRLGREARGGGISQGVKEIGRAACRGRGEISVGAGSLKKKKTMNDMKTLNPLNW